MSSPGVEADRGCQERRLRVLHLLRESSYGTASTVAEIVPALERLGVDVDVVLLSNGRSGAPSASIRLEDAGVAFRRLPIATIHRWMRPAFLFKLADPVRIARRLADASADVLHCHGPLPLAAGLLRRRQCAVVTTFHGMTNPRSLSQRAYRAAVGLADAVIALKAEDTRAIRRFRRAARVHPARNGIDVARWQEKIATAETLRDELGIPRDAFVVGLVGRLSREKGIEPFLAATARSGGLERVDAHILIAGSGPQEKRIADLIAEHPALTKRAHRLGYRADVETLLRTVDAVAIPSETESQPMVALEAMACGVPVAAFAVGALPEMLADGAGLLVPRGAFDHLTDALDRLRTSPEERVAIIDAARRRVRESYDADTVARDLLETIYRPLIAKKRT